MNRMFGDHRSRFSLRKYSFGVASVLLSTIFFGMGTAHADQVETSTTGSVATPESFSVPENDFLDSDIEESVSVASATSRESIETPAEFALTAPATSSMPRRQGYVATTTGTALLDASGGSVTTFEKNGTQITVTNPEVRLEYPNGNLKDQGNKVIYDNIQFPEDISINEGDKVVLTLPRELGIRTSYSFPVYNENNDLVGQAYADAATNLITTTFNNYFESYPTNKSMSLSLDTIWSDDVVPGNDYVLDFDGRRIPGRVGDYGEIVGDEVVRKTGTQNKDNGHVIDWSVRLNYARRLLNNIEIIDSWSNNQRYVPGSLDIRDEYYNDARYLIKEFKYDDTNFSLKLDQLDRLIYVWYSTQLNDAVENSTNPTNNMIVLADGDQVGRDGFEVEIVGGHGDVSGDRATASPINFHFELKKALEGRELKDQEFTFKLEDITDPSVPADKGEVKNTADGKIILPTVTVSKAGTYKYRVTEISGSEAEMIYDPMVAEITVEVKEELVGNQPTLVSKIIYPEDIEFNNKLASPASAQIKFTKALAGRDLVAGEFQFELLDKDGKVVDTASNTANGEVNFKPISYDKIDTYTYTVREVKGSDASITYDPMVATVTVTVQKDGSSLVSTVQNPADTEFNNTYTLPTEAKAQIEFTKALAGRDLKAGEFTFVLKDGTGKEVERVTNTADGKVNFAELSFKEAGTYTYTVEEVAGKDEDLVYDPMIATVTITVTKNGNAFVATVTNPADTEFNNRLKEQEAGKAKFEFTKALAGRDLKAGEFSFVLKDESGRELQTVTNTADGKVSFDEITYDKVGTYKYTISEVAGSDVSIDYDKMVAEVTVTVTKEIGAEKNTFVAVKTLPADMEFNNTYIAPTKAQFTFTKALSGRELKDKEFMFALFERNENGQDVFLGFAQNDANGQVVFDAIDYDAEGTHNYYVVEVIGNDAAVTYDRMEAEVTVTVTKNPATNSLEATVVMPEDSEFNNSVTPPTPPTPPSPYIPPKPGEPTPPTPPVPNTPPKPGEPTPPTPPSPNTPTKPGERTPKKPQLPNTGTASDSAALAGLGLMGVLAGFGLARKKKED